MNDELILLACCMLDSRLVDKAIELGLVGECFNEGDYRVLWDGMVERRKHGQSCDNRWSRGYLKDRVGKEYAGVFAKAMGNVNQIVEFYSAVENVLRDYHRMQLAQMLGDGLTETETGDPILIADKLLADLTKFRTEQVNDAETDIMETIQQRLNKTNQIRTGIPRLTWMTKGIERGVFWVIGGFTSHGKTQLALNLALNIAEQEQPVTYFSTEMNEVSLTMRLATILSGVNPSLSNSLTTEEKDAFITDVQKLALYPIELTKTLSLSNIRLTIQKRKSLLYVVDYIQMIYPDRYIDNEVKRLGYVSRELETMSKEYDVCIIATSQFHRPARKDGVAIQPTLQSFRGSGEIEESTDIGLLIYYPYMMASFDKKKEMENDGKDKDVQLCVSKNRLHGLTGVIKLEFDRQTMRFKQQGVDDDTPF